MVVQEITPDFVPWARIKVFWVWWWGGNTVDRMIEEWLTWVEFVAINTDAQALVHSKCPNKINIWLNITRWLWWWANPEIWRKSAEENIDEIKKVLQDTDMVFITAWMWWGTWTWAAPVVAEVAKELWILTVWVVTKPFSFEWKKRLENAIEGLEKLKNSVDTLIVIPNDKIFNIIDKKTTFRQSFMLIDKILLLWVQWISDLVIKPWNINIDFADIKVIMQNSWTALLWIWYWEWENRSIDAARRAIDNPLLEANLEWAKNIIFAVTWWDDLTPMEVQDAARVVEEIADSDANIIWWMTFDDSYEWEVKVTIIATWFPEVTQTNILKWTTKTNEIWVRRSKWEDFVNRAIKNDSSPTNPFTQTSSKPQPTTKVEDDEDDYETPAFLRKKLWK